MAGAVTQPARSDGIWYGEPPRFSGNIADFAWRWHPTKIPHFTFERIGVDRPVSLSGFKGKVVLLNVWATWCPPCVAEMPALDKLQKLRGGEDFAVVALSVDNLGSDVVTDFMKKQNLKSLTAYIGNGRETFDHFRMKELPTTFLIGRDGQVWGAMAGPAEWSSQQALDLIDYAIGLKPKS